MNHRQIKKYSKLLKEAAPNLFKDAWLDTDECGVGTYSANTWVVGGGVDYFGEAGDIVCCYDHMMDMTPMLSSFERYPDSHPMGGSPIPNIDFNSTFPNLLKLAKRHG